MWIGPPHPTGKLGLARATLTHFGALRDFASSPLRGFVASRSSLHQAAGYENGRNQWDEPTGSYLLGTSLKADPLPHPRASCTLPVGCG